MTRSALRLGCVMLAIGIAATPLAAQTEKRSGKKRASPTPSATASPRPSGKAKGSPTPSRKKASPTLKSEPDAEASPSLPPRKKRAVSPAPEASGSPAKKPSPARTSSPSPSASPKPSAAASATPEPTRAAAPNASLSSSELGEFDKQPADVQALIEDALALTTQDLTYAYGSADPESGGLDCSGFIYHTLRKKGLDDVPRSASEQYVWARKAGKFFAVVSRKNETFELEDLEPGDLLFWTGTYTVDRDPPITHTMIYLGKEKRTGKRVMVGSSDGRSYEGRSRWGVSVFDFKVASGKADGSGARFVGYAKIPGLRPAE